MSGEAIARRVVVSGRVQGVAFRDATRREAATRAVAGWVRNRPDGTVEAHLEGAPGDVEAMLRFLHRGPPAARVDAVAVEEAPAAGGDGFAIR